MAARAGPGETLSIPGMPAIEPRMIDIPDAGGDGGDEVEVDSLVQADATVPGTCGIEVSTHRHSFKQALTFSHQNRKRS